MKDQTCTIWSLELHGLRDLGEDWTKGRTQELSGQNGSTKGETTKGETTIESLAAP